VEKLEKKFPRSSASNALPSDSDFFRHQRPWQAIISPVKILGMNSIPGSAGGIRKRCGHLVFGVDRCHMPPSPFIHFTVVCRCIFDPSFRASILNSRAGRSYVLHVRGRGRGHGAFCNLRAGKLASYIRHLLKLPEYNSASTAIVVLDQSSR